MTRTELKLAKHFGKKMLQDKDLLINVRAKLFEAETVISDAIEFCNSLDNEKRGALRDWLDDVQAMHSAAGNFIKEA